MRWNDDANAAMAKAPLIIRRMITKRVEKSVREQGREIVTLADVEQLQAKAMGGAISDQQIEDMVRSSRPQVYRDERTYEVRVCNLADCPRSFYDVKSVAEKMVQVIENSRVPEAVVRRASGPVLRHHRLLVSISGCPNSCSQPQIADFGVQGRARPMIASGNCIGCGECVRVCTENAVEVSDNEPMIDRMPCMDCGDCAGICPTEAITTGEYGFSVLIGGKLGRHPQLARTLFDFADEKTLLNALQICCKVFADEMQPGERLANTVDRIGVTAIAHRCVS
ncbi:MAG: 4Fe-4S dicluster domain-containing protein [Armatimonadota bacterium]